MAAHSKPGNECELERRMPIARPEKQGLRSVAEGDFGPEFSAQTGGESLGRLVGCNRRRKHSVILSCPRAGAGCDDRHGAITVSAGPLAVPPGGREMAPLDLAEAEDVDRASAGRCLDDRAPELPADVEEPQDRTLAHLEHFAFVKDALPR